jgi:ribosomal protein S18 acetylase RimI-like enzyme
MLKKLCRSVLTKIRRALYVRVTDIIEQIDLQAFGTLSIAVPSELAARRFDPLLDQVISTQLGHSLFQDFLKRSQLSLGYILWQDQEAVGYLWATDHPRLSEGESPFFYDIHPPTHARYFYDLKILPKCRRKGAATTLMAMPLDDAKKAGKSIVFATRASWNLPMERVFRKLGFQVAGNIKLKRILGFKQQDLRALHV